MLKLRIMRWNGKCRKHPAFDPAKDGRGAVKGGCKACEALCDINDIAERLKRAITDARPQFPQTRERKRKEPEQPHQYTIEDLLMAPGNIMHAFNERHPELNQTGEANV
jgi:hypothetical protein